MIILEPYIQPEEDFVKHMLVRPKECYQKAKKEGWRKAHGDRPLLSIIKDVSQSESLGCAFCMCMETLFGYQEIAYDSKCVWCYLLLGTSKYI